MPATRGRYSGSHSVEGEGTGTEGGHGPKDVAEVEAVVVYQQEEGGGEGGEHPSHHCVAGHIFDHRPYIMHTGAR